MLSPQAQMKAALIEAQEDADTWRRRAEEGGSMFDLQRDTPKDIGRIVVGRCSPTKAKAYRRCDPGRVEAPDASARGVREHEPGTASTP